jgi:hypothetical protein
MSHRVGEFFGYHSLRAFTSRLDVRARKEGPVRENRPFLVFRIRWFPAARMSAGARTSLDQASRCFLKNGTCTSSAWFTASAWSYRS